MCCNLCQTSMYSRMAPSPSDPWMSKIQVRWRRAAATMRVHRLLAGTRATKVGAMVEMELPSSTDRSRSSRKSHCQWSKSWMPRKIVAPQDQEAIEDGTRAEHDLLPAATTT